MKIRRAMVSNSSSLSFMVPLSAAKTAADLAAIMIQARGFPWDDNDLEHLILAINDGMDPDVLIFFSTINYETLITKTSHGHIVETSNNHCWSDHFKTTHVSKEAWEEATGIDYYEYDPDTWHRNIENLTRGKVVFQVCSQTYSRTGELVDKNWEFDVEPDGSINIKKEGES